MLAEVRFAVLVAAVALSIASNPGPDDPEVDACGEISGATASAVDIGRDGIGPFMGLAAGDSVTLVSGSQGSDMLPVRFLVSGLGDGCVPQQTEVRYCPPGSVCADGGQVVASSNVGLRTYEHGEDRVTTDHFLILGSFVEAGGQLSVSTTVAGAADSVTVVIGEFR